jgi:hypothetical protein
MPKSKHRKSHKVKLNQYKDETKRKNESMKKMMIENYMKMQQANLAGQEEHTSTEEVVGPEINIDDLNIIEDWEPNIDVEVADIEVADIDKEWIDLADTTDPLDKPIEL